jgi:hypothetical protein
VENTDCGVDDDNEDDGINVNCFSVVQFAMANAYFACIFRNKLF